MIEIIPDTEYTGEAPDTMQDETTDREILLVAAEEE